MTVPNVPLLAHASAAAIVAYRDAKAITAQQFLADVTQLAAVLPDGGHVLNACTDRYRFAVALAATLLRRKTSLLPPTLAPEVIRHLKAFAPEAFCLTDEATCSIDLPIVQVPCEPATRLMPYQVPAIAGDQLAAYIFTSGSTGRPVPHPKTWNRLCRSVQFEAERLGLTRRGPWAILATVPPQHMFGFESSVLLALQNGYAFCAERPFYPADIVERLRQIPAPRLLVSTPIHLRALLASTLELPPLDLVLVATAPLSAQLAAQVETAFNAPLLEIYGSTETGQIASRRTTMTSEWELWPDVELIARNGETWAQGELIAEPTAMADILELLPARRFLLHGRTADLVNIAGKRSSIAYLTHQLTAIPGVIDGVFFLRDDAGDVATKGEARLSAVVVAPGLSASTITQHLRNCLDPAFLPRPVVIVDQIPRDATGKLPLTVLRSLTARR